MQPLGCIFLHLEQTQLFRPGVGLDRAFRGRAHGRRLAMLKVLPLLEVVQAWVDPTQKKPKTLHHQGYGVFVVDGETIRLKSGKA